MMNVQCVHHVQSLFFLLLRRKKKRMREEEEESLTSVLVDDRIRRARKNDECRM